MYKPLKTAVELNFYLEPTKETQGSFKLLMDILQRDELEHEIPQELRLILNTRYVFLVPKKTKILVRIMAGPNSIKKKEEKIRGYLDTILKKLGNGDAYD